MRRAIGRSEAAAEYGRSSNNHSFTGFQGKDQAET
ncbi:hypothetical protein PC129_g10615 [Phytophthora cactorum]|uniref:Uncharacterized protein n=1 Tax=Phytophthora cactorum TaxID=29920 RepID=A0A8T1I3H2_9STRA|nr:hypothetical protein Pcac1_g19538 [Phytophthora cactorum]KAG2819030.1 hypothetical protein PC112_g12361 [Phytophthora cactorum]KAG2854970.1 hypothetical protein PC113_g12841 [Phytophthora cactorum]KAG2898774.1 hypothetical protein PC114_g14154 [Phytophthora cactorum]KAG2913097.1 hypothetical protein PC115_g12151 [Phytophthora cactorum]